MAGSPPPLPTTGSSTDLGFEIDQNLKIRGEKKFGSIPLWLQQLTKYEIASIPWY